MLQAPKRTLADKYKVGGEFHDRIQHIFSKESDMLVHSSNGRIVSKKRDIKTLKIKSISVIITVLILFIAIVKNPSQSESEKQIKLYLVELIKDAAFEKSSESEESDSSKGFEMFLINAFAPTYVDAVANIQTSDYIVFSTFNALAEDKGKVVNLVSGIILFGKIIPLSTDMNKKY